jgi:PTS system nitrogen regulatory IIA component
MGNDVMGLEELAVYLQRDLREVQKMASRGYIPGQKVSGEWRFHQAEINHWLESQMHAYTEQELSQLEAASDRDDAPPLLITPILSEATMAVPLPATTRTSVLNELVQLAEQSWLVYDPEGILNAVRQREEMGSTALPSGIAIPHPHRPLPNALGDDVIAFGRTVSGIPFGGEYGGLTDLYFLVLCRDYSKHLRALARLSRLFLRPNFIHDLRAAESARAVMELIEKTETELMRH